MKLAGKVIDAQSGQPLSFAHISCETCLTGTSANEEGDFEITVDSLPVKLHFSYVGYQSAQLLLKDYSPTLLVKLTPGRILLAEVTIAAQPDRRYLQTLLLAAFNKARQQATHKAFAQAFYRQTTSNDSVYSEVYEIFYHTQVSTTGIQEWQPLEGRYAISGDLARNKYVYTDNFTFLSQTFNLLGESPTTPFLTPSNKYSLKKYVLSLSKILQTNGRRVAIVAFKPLTNVKQVALAGQLWIDLDNYDILRMKGELKDPKLRLIEVSGPKRRWSNYERVYDIAFKLLHDTLLVPDYLQIEHTMNYAVSKTITRRITTRSLITFYAYRDSLNIDRNQAETSKEDSELIQSLPYKPEFWQNNPYLLQTPLEKQVIESFEQRGAVGNLFAEPGSIPK
ncbi:carboxypeptidase-like regulatory domain-containing protein [Rhodocytophaga aerolata]